ncbi:hypothetical protein B0675_25675 [Streptomyces sp. M41(2017)]|uniref:hypothetical protein n=1 Tax=Streptomyces sp. M41(2017) TaxID=1955065 RepID=UPI0009C148B2|nr:hypothetical protein [Streptomyces sp. M41(2017)]OQQ13664.1 hypothetical protein B0675_25675 [Streptomyces sp. M41(2017)]
MKLSKRVASLFATTTLLGTTLVGLSAADASAAGVCDQSFLVGNKTSGGGNLRWNAAIRPKPYESCGSYGTFAEGTKFWYWCDTYNDYGNRWIYGRVDGTQTTGWIYAPNVAPVSGLVSCF